MTVEQFLAAPKDVPIRARSMEVVDSHRMEERALAVQGRFGPILGWIEGGMQFVPDNDPPTRDEILGWLWVIHPELKTQILQYADSTLRQVIREYEEDTPIPRVEAGERLRAQLGRKWTCPFCLTRSTDGDGDTQWVECPIRRDAPAFICVGCCTRIAAACRAEELGDHPYRDFVEDAAQTEDRTVEETRRSCLAHQREVLEERSSVRPDPETDDLLGRIRALLTSF